MAWPSVSADARIGLARARFPSLVKLEQALSWQVGSASTNEDDRSSASIILSGLTLDTSATARGYLWVIEWVSECVGLANRQSAAFSVSRQIRICAS